MVSKKFFYSDLGFRAFRNAMKWFGLAAMIAPALALLFLFDPASSIIYPPCPFHEITGYYCPGCGSLRSLHQLLHAHPLKALSLNPLMILSLPFLSYILISDYLGSIQTLKSSQLFSSPRSVWILLGIILVFWIIRNIPLYPFSWLAP
jgi:hypothetical protein